MIAFCPGLSFQCSGESCNQTLFQIQSWRNRHEQAGLGTLPAGHQVLCSKNDRHKTKGIVHEKKKATQWTHSKNEKEGRKHQGKQNSWRMKNPTAGLPALSTYTLVTHWSPTAAWNRPRKSIYKSSNRKLLNTSPQILMQFLGIWRQCLRNGIVLAYLLSFSEFDWMWVNDSSQVLSNAKEPWEPRPWEPVESPG